MCDLRGVREVTLRLCSRSLIHKRAQDKWKKVKLKAAEWRRSGPASAVGVCLRECTWQHSYAPASEAQSLGGLLSSLKSLFSLGPKQMSDVICFFFFF